MSFFRLRRTRNLHANTVRNTRRPTEVSADQEIPTFLNIDDCCHFHTVVGAVRVVIRDVRNDGLVLVQNEMNGVGAFSFLVRSDTLLPIERPSAVTRDDVRRHQQRAGINHATICAAQKMN